jgi:hypothetical protein
MATHEWFSFALFFSYKLFRAVVNRMNLFRFPYKVLFKRNRFFLRESFDAVSHWYMEAETEKRIDGRSDVTKTKGPFFYWHERS